MEIIKLSSLTSPQKAQIDKLWNEEYPLKLKDRFNKLLEETENNCHFIIENEKNEVLAWAVTFEKDNETRFSIIVRKNEKGKGLGSLLMEKLKAETEEFYGWVIDHNNDLKSNGEPYKTPLLWYTKLGFETLHDKRLDTEMISAVKIKWTKKIIMDKGFVIRTITKKDAAEVLEIYKYYVLNTIISFEYEAPSLAEYDQRIETNSTDYPWLVCLQNGKVIGYAYASKHRYRSAYQWSPESTVYLSPEVHGKGIGRILYETLFALLRLQGHFNVYAGVGLPNNKSVNFHKALGFEEIGIFKKVGYKHGNWHDTHWFQLHLSEHIIDPPVPKKTREVEATPAFQSILAKANEKMMRVGKI